MTELLDGGNWNWETYSNGWVTGNGGLLDAREPATGETLAEVGLADAADIASAVRAAGAA